MNVTEDAFYNDLRKKLDVMGYTETLPILGIPLVGAIFSDLIKTTENLRDTKKKVVDLLEEKSCWELGVEPYKCDNKRLLKECNNLNQQLMQEREDYEQRICEYQNKLRNLESDKRHLTTHCEQLQQQLDTLHAKQSLMLSKKSSEHSTQKGKKPFITTVRSGDSLPPLPPTSSNTQLKCTKCNAGIVPRLVTNTSCTSVVPPLVATQAELDKLDSSLKTANEQIELCKRKIDAREREIRRLNDLLTGGRPPAALAKDCCFKDVGAMSQDLELLQREKMEHLQQIDEYQSKMHDAMQKALETANEKKELEKELEEFKEAALQVETQANTELATRDAELRQFERELKQLQRRNESLQTEINRLLGKRITAGGKSTSNVVADAPLKHKLNERLKWLTQRESELQAENAKLKRKLQKQQCKICEMQREIKASIESQKKVEELQQEKTHLNEEKTRLDAEKIRIDEEKIRLKSERDFYQQEYLRLLSKTGSETEIGFLQDQIKTKDEELRALRSELCLQVQTNICPLKPMSNNHAAVEHDSARSASSNANSNRSDCVRAVVMRVERERDCARAELERLRCERDALQEKQLCLSRMHAEELQAARQRNDELYERLKQLERENRDLNSARLPNETQLVLLKEECAQLRQRLQTSQDEHTKLKAQYNTLKTLHEQTERTMADLQNKLILTERQLQTADMRANTLDSNRESSRSETSKLQAEIAALKQTYIALEHEKDKLLNQLDAKTERTYQLEYDLKACKEQRNYYEQQFNDLQSKLDELTKKTLKRSIELKETSVESSNLRDQIIALKQSRDNAIAENTRLSNELAASQAEVSSLNKKMSESVKEIDRMKRQLRQYVQEVKKAEDLLIQKEKERDEMLEHYQSLSNDAVQLQGNNQSLEDEASEYKRQISELEIEIESLKSELCCRQRLVDQLEDKITTLSARNNCLDHQLLQSNDELRMCKEDIKVYKELCNKFDVEKTKLKAEIEEFKEILSKLENENKELRDTVEVKQSQKRVSNDTMSDLLAKERLKSEMAQTKHVKSMQDIARFRHELHEVFDKLDKEREDGNLHRQEAAELRAQLEEMKRIMNDVRFQEARTRQKFQQIGDAKTM